MKWDHRNIEILNTTVVYIKRTNKLILMDKNINFDQNIYIIHTHVTCWISSKQNKNIIKLKTFWQFLTIL